MPVIEQKITPNEKQQDCINAIENPVMVLAGPGTGKTYTLVKRIENMLSSAISSENILCLTFSDTAAVEMKNRLLENLGIAASNAQINTYHAFCNNVIRLFPSKFELFDSVNLIDDISKITLMKQSMDEIKPKALTTKWGNYYFYIKKVLKAIDEIKQNQVKKKDYFKLLETDEKWGLALILMEKELEERIKKGKTRNTTRQNAIITQKKKITQAKEIWELYELYTIKMQEKNFIDFNDMLNFVVETFENDKLFLKEVTKKFKYVMVDEYQDTNFLQNKLISLILDGANTQNIFVVGDDDQIIYGFQGAKSDNMEKFLDKYKNATLICLNENNRSTQSILNFSYNLISKDTTRLEANPNYSHLKISKKLTAKNETVLKLEKPVELHIFEQNVQENNEIILKIKEILKSKNTKLSQIAILTRETKELYEFARLLENNNINFQMKTSKTIFELKPSILIYFYLKVLNNCYLASDKLFGLLMSEPFNFNNKDYNFLLMQNRPVKRNFIEIIRDNLDKNWEDKEKINNFIKTYDYLFSMKSHLTLTKYIYEIINRTGILAFYSNSEINKIENIQAIKRLIDEAKTFEMFHQSATFTEFIQHLDLAFNEGVPIEIENSINIQNAIRLSTIHSSKGQEFEYVFLPNLIDTKWEKKAIKDVLSIPISQEEKTQKEKDSENLKLLFVGITRAKHFLWLSYAKQNENKSQNLTNYISETFQNKDYSKIILHENNTDYYNEIVNSMTKKEYNYHLAFENELCQRLNDFTLSAHSLNSFLNCPRAFLYENIYEIPTYDANRTSADYGSAIHKMIEFTTGYAIEKGIYPTINEAKKVFTDKLNSYSFETENIYEQYLNRGINAIENYFPRLIKQNIENIFATEHLISEIEFEQIKLKGFIDRIEKFNDGTYGLYDYKTGEAKSEKQIADGGDYENYWNQLKFYKLIFELKYPKFKVSKVGLIFIEDNKNKYFDVIENDEEILKDKILLFKQEIKKLKFDPINQDSYNECKNCKYCNFKMICKLNVI